MIRDYTLAEQLGRILLRYTPTGEAVLHQSEVIRDQATALWQGCLVASLQGRDVDPAASGIPGPPLPPREGLELVVSMLCACLNVDDEAMAALDSARPVNWRSDGGVPRFGGDGAAALEGWKIRL